jgi:hypothetical protein
MATPFVQGHLRREYLAVEIRTVCAHCAQPIHMTVDSDMRCHVRTAGAAPLVFEPHIDWEAFAEPNIIRAY